MASRKAIPVAALACLFVATPHMAASASPFQVVSTLDGKTVLPHHIRWRGEPTLSAAAIKEVDFLIDGRVRWVVTRPPYGYAFDATWAHPGFLVTTWLRPGRHRFAVRAVAKGGRTATDAVAARVLPAPEVPTKLVGTWRRTLARSVPAGTYAITFDRRWLEDRLPGRFRHGAGRCSGCILRDDYAPGPRTFTVWGAVVTGPAIASSPVRGWWCDPGGPTATYSWSVSGSTLTLAPLGGSDPCRRRGLAWTGRWTRSR
jgi:hypothetical protein